MNQGINNISVEIFPKNEHRKRFENFQAIQKITAALLQRLRNGFYKKVVILPASVH